MLNVVVLLGARFLARVTDLQRCAHRDWKDEIFVWPLFALSFIANTDRLLKWKMRSLIGSPPVNLAVGNGKWTSVEKTLSPTFLEKEGGGDGPASLQISASVLKKFQNEVPSATAWLTEQAMKKESASSVTWTAANGFDCPSKLILSLSAKNCLNTPGRSPPAEAGSKTSLRRREEARAWTKRAPVLEQVTEMLPVEGSVEVRIC